MFRHLLAVLAVSAALLVAPARAQHDHAGHASPTTSDVPSALTADEAAGLVEGRGLGMARPAEVNGYPGPLHVLELADALTLSESQRAEAERLRAAMLAETVPLGRQIVEVERHLDGLFASGDASPEAVDRITTHAAALRGRLRALHLRAHLGMRDALTADQVAAYAQLRGVDG